MTTGAIERCGVLMGGGVGVGFVMGFGRCVIIPSFFLYLLFITIFSLECGERRRGEES